MYAVFVFKSNACHFVESHTIPKPDKTDLLARHIVEKVGNRSLPAGHEDGVRRYLLIKVRLARAAGSKFAKVEVIFNQWKHTGELQPLLTIGESVGFHTRGAEQNSNPLILSKGTTTVLDFIHIDVRHLNRRQLHDTNWSGLFVFLDVLIFKTDNAPDSTAKQAVIF